MTKQLCIVVGPTGVGKSSLVDAAADEIGGAVINLDSVQVYQGLDIGSAKPCRRRLNSGRYHLFDYVPLGDELTAGEFSRQSRQLYAELTATHVWAVGGSGFYVQAFEVGMPPWPTASVDQKQQIEMELRKIGYDQAHSILAAEAPQFRLRFHAADTYRVQRAWTLRYLLGPSWMRILEEFEEQKRAAQLVARKVGIRLERNELIERLKSRIVQMLAAGWIDEVQSVREQGFADWRPLRAAGYKQISDYLDGQIERGELFECILKAHASLAKRQMTWFRRDSSIEWFDANQSERALASLKTSPILST